MHIANTASLLAVHPVVPAKFAAYLAAELKKWSKVAKDAGITAE